MNACSHFQELTYCDSLQRIRYVEIQNFKMAARREIKNAFARLAFSRTQSYFTMLLRLYFDDLGLLTSTSPRRCSTRCLDGRLLRGCDDKAPVSVASRNSSAKVSKLCAALTRRCSPGYDDKAPVTMASRKAYNPGSLDDDSAELAGRFTACVAMKSALRMMEFRSSSTNSWCDRCLL